MNLPNKLTISRIILVPLICAAMAIPTEAKYVSCVLFILAAITDYADGHLARSRGLITDFGKFLDPIADKLLVICPMIILIQLGRYPAWMCAVTVARELTVSGFRLLAALKDRVIAADKLGKYKTTFQMLSVISMLLIGSGSFLFIPLILNWISLLLCVISGGMYLFINRDILATENTQTTPEEKDP